jgi:PPOX class probable F420-dependent enzyme
MRKSIPDSHIDLITRPIHGVLTTMMPDGQPQSSLVWCTFDGEFSCINTSLERQKGKNLILNPRANLLVIDPDDTTRYLEIRGEAELVEDGALDHLDKVTRQYTIYPKYYGYVFPVERQAQETRIIVRIKPTRINLDAIHK